MILIKSGNVNSVAMKTKFASKKRRSQRKQQSTTWWKQLHKFKTKRLWARKTSPSSLLWINLDPCVSQHPYKESINWKVIRPTKWKSSWNSVMALTSFFRENSKSLMSVGCSACKLLSINKLLISEMEPLIGKLVWLVSMIKSRLLEMELKILRAYVVIS